MPSYRISAHEYSYYPKLGQQSSAAVYLGAAGAGAIDTGNACIVEGENPGFAALAQQGMGIDAECVQYPGKPSI